MVDLRIDNWVFNPGDWVKIKKEFKDVDGINGERFWIKVTKIIIEVEEKITIEGVVDNNLLYTDQHGYKDGDKMIITPEDILDVLLEEETEEVE